MRTPYALLGWVVWKVGKRLARRRLSGLTREAPGRGLALVASAVAAVAGVAWFARRRGGKGDGEMG